MDSNSGIKILDGATNPNNSIVIFSQPQIEKLQGQIRFYKTLSKRYNDLISQNNTNASESKESYTTSQVHPQSSVKNESILPSSKAEETPKTEQEIVQKEQPAPVNPPLPITTLSWQCFSSLLFSGSHKGPDGMISVHSSVSSYTINFEIINLILSLTRMLAHF